jgi:hypothetical protein
MTVWHSSASVRKDATCDNLGETKARRDRFMNVCDESRILNTELRLVTPAEPEGALADETQAAAVKGGIPLFPTGQLYQLTHDYLVPALRRWLTRKQQETWRGRAELLLEERAAQGPNSASHRLTRRVGWRRLRQRIH